MTSQAEAKISRTRKKKQALALQRIGEQLVGLSDDQLKAMALPEDLQSAVQDAKGMTKHEARRRQMQFIGSLMRHSDGTAIEQALQELQRQDDAEVRRFKAVETWRDELVAGDTDRMQWILDAFPDADVRHLSRLVDAATGLTEEKARRKAGRQLFRYLVSIQK